MKTIMKTLSRLLILQKAHFLSLCKRMKTKILENDDVLFFIHRQIQQPAKAAISPRSSPLVDVLRGEKSGTQRKKFHTDDVNQCLHNNSHGVPNSNLFNFTFLLVDFGKVLCSSAKELQQNANGSSREEYIPQILTVFLQIHRVYIWPLQPFVFCPSFVNSS